ncbi:MAG: T9SS type A sorting domain-containing protein [Bacteroidaceae bacterium]|nr:T9SS type A sorting domain-containing protein [Bacteroidaceae bacterium]
MKRIFLVAYLLAVALGSRAQQAALRVWTAQETSTLYVFSAQPVISFTPAEIQIKAEGAELILDKHDYVKFTFEDADIEDDIRTVDDEAMIHMDGNHVTAHPLKPGSTIRIYGLNGVMVQSATADASGQVRLDMGSLPAGIYVVHSSVGSFKFIKK